MHEIIDRLDDECVLGGSNFSDTDKLHKITVPSGERWWLHSIWHNRDVSSTIIVEVYNVDDEKVATLLEYGAGTGHRTWPNNEVAVAIAMANHACPYPLKAGDYVSFTFSTSQTAAAAINARFTKRTMK